MDPDLLARPGAGKSRRFQSTAKQRGRAQAVQGELKEHLQGLAQTAQDLEDVNDALALLRRLSVIRPSDRRQMEEEVALVKRSFFLKLQELGISASIWLEN